MGEAGNLIYSARSYIRKTTSAKRTPLSLLEKRAEPPCFSAVAVMDARPIPLPLCFVERYLSFFFPDMSVKAVCRDDVQAVFVADFRGKGKIT